MTLALSAAVVAVLVVLSLAVLAAVSWLRLRGTRLVECPETRQPVAVEVDMKHLLATGVGGLAEFRLRDCTRWPEKAGCGQMCLSEIEGDPHGCLVREILGRWYEGKACTLCGHPIAPVHWHDHRPAFKGADNRIHEWGDVRPEDLPAFLPTARAVCWSCMVAEGFRRDHPELVVDRRRPTGLHPPF